jgi:hypothetical protein
MRMGRIRMRLGHACGWPLTMPASTGPALRRTPRMPGVEATVRVRSGRCRRGQRTAPHGSSADAGLFGDHA